MIVECGFSFNGIFLRNEVLPQIVGYGEVIYNSTTADSHGNG